MDITQVPAFIVLFADRAALNRDPGRWTKHLVIRSRPDSRSRIMDLAPLLIHMPNLRRFLHAGVVRLGELWTLASAHITMLTLSLDFGGWAGAAALEQIMDLPHLRILDLTCVDFESSSAPEHMAAELPLFRTSGLTKLDWTIWRASHTVLQQLCRLDVPHLGHLEILVVAEEGPETPGLVHPAFEQLRPFVARLGNLRTLRLTADPANGETLLQMFAESPITSLELGFTPIPPLHLSETVQALTIACRLEQASVFQMEPEASTWACLDSLLAMPRSALRSVRLDQGLQHSSQLVPFVWTQCLRLPPTYVQRRNQREDRNAIIGKLCCYAFQFALRDVVLEDEHGNPPPFATDVRSVFTLEVPDAHACPTFMQRLVPA
jgi:hypothetical protein